MSRLWSRSALRAIAACLPSWLLLALLPGVAPRALVAQDGRREAPGDLAALAAKFEVPVARCEQILAGALPRGRNELSMLQARIREIHALAARATVTIGGAAGVLVEGGFVLTAGHVAETAGRRVPMRTSDGSWLSGITLGGSEETDTGLVRVVSDAIPESCRVLRLRNSAELERGAFVLMLGFPGSRRTEGPPLRFGRVLRNPARGYLETDCRMCSGDSGGPLVDLTGSVVGINSRITRDLAKNMHVATATYLREWDDLVASQWTGGRGSRAFLGVETRAEQDGTRVVRVVEGSAAERAGLRADDLILALDRHSLDGSANLPSLLGSYRPGRSVLLRLVRGDETLEVRVRLGAREQ
ncbi:MAG: trypsin-like peptidase domain-containing protein [Planctomycetes bacterium]|nr:trypsin-like peptidase domain-containing protein [Planctomycetota bacterium]MCB9918023.1 trypsin-like peptidase domain-containing protein [Planctomycetota bacterium]